MESMGKAIPIPIAHRQVQQQEHHQNKQQLEHVESNNSSLNSYSFPPQPQSQSKRSNSQSIPLNSSNDNDEVEGEREISYSPELIKRSSSSTGSNSTMILKNESDINHNRSNSNNSNSSYGKGGVNISNNRSNEIEPIPTEYSSIGKQIYAGRQNFSFSEFISDSNEDNVPSSLSNNSINSTPVITYGTLPPSSFPNRFNTPALLLRRPSTLLSSNSSSSPYSNFAPPPPPSIHPYQWNGYTTSTHTTTSHLSSTSTSLNSPCCSNPEPHSHFAPPPINPSQLLNPSGYYSSDSRLQFGTTNQNFNRDHQRIISSSSSSYYPQIVYGSTTGNNGLVRSVSSQSSISAQSNNSSQGTGHYSSSDSPTLRQTSTISAYQQYQQQLQQEQQEQQESLSTTNSPIQSRLKQQHNPSTSSTPHQSQTPAHYVYGTKLVNGTASTSDLEDLTELQIYNSSKTSAVTRSGINHSASTRSMTIDSTITPSTNTTTPRTKTKTSTTTPKPKKLSSASKLASGKNIFHPSPNSMLAPNSTLSTKVRGLDSKTGKILPAAFPGTNSPGTPSDAEFAKMMTKRSRGRRPPDSSALGLLNSDPSDGFSPVSGGNNLDGDYGEFGGMSTEGEGEGNSESFDTNLVPTKEQLALFGGYTKTGKVKKVFLCKVPGCGKCFKRSEHLKRHVRSIHTNDKRKFNLSLSFFFFF